MENTPMRRRFTASPELDVLLGAIVLEHGQAPAAPPAPVAPSLSGRVNLHPRGFAFITTEAGESYYLRAPLARPLLTGDEVQFRPADVTPEEGREVRAVMRVTRGAGFMLCEVRQDEAGLALAPDEPCFVTLALQDAPASLITGDVVLVRLPAYEGPAALQPIPVAFVQRLGPRTEAGFDLAYARARFGFHEEMPGALAHEAQAPVAESSAESADAWTTHAGVPFVTIDGESTRDLDDAVYARRLDSGWEVQVAIADVSWYVRPGSGLDAWAAQRCTSLYLPGCVVPMLPEALSTDRCSLMAGVLRRAVVLTLTLDEAGHVTASQLQRGLIQSAARLSYGQVAAFLAGKNVRFAAPVEASLRALADVYALLSRQREEAGRLDFDDPEPTLVQDGGNWRIRWETRNDAHRLVEELMLLANRVAATMLVERYGAGLFRHQPPPDADAWRELRDWAQVADQALPESPSMQALAALASAFGGDAQAAAALRIRAAMQPAKYVVKNQDAPGGHFSLSMNWYTHFTSPIRRYADLLVHRLLLAPAGTQLTEAEWIALGAQVAQCSERSHAARLAERMVWDRLKLAAFMADKPVGEAVRARVVRANARGLRVVIQGWQCSAWLAAGDLRSKGFQRVDEMWVGPAGGEPSRVLTEGTSLLVSWRELSRERPAYPELQVDFLPEAN